jgi:arylsulfatase A-like enzyme
MKPPKALVIVVDGLRASALGAYGNTWHPTPALDALAATSTVCDWMWSPSLELPACCRALWGDGQHSLARQVAASGGVASLVTDDASVADLADAAGFGETWRVDDDSPAAAAEVSDTALARFMAAATERLSAMSSPGDDARLWWIYARGFRGPWDAPQGLRAQLLEDDEIEVPAFVDPPCAGTEDDDMLLGCRAAYAAQTIVLDQCIGGLLAGASEWGVDEEALVILAGSRGFALGEHGAVGDFQPRLYGESLHVPCLIRAPRTGPAPPRLTSLAQLADVQATLARWFDLEPADGAAIDLLSSSARGMSRQVVTSVGAGGERALRTPAWMVRLAPVEDRTTDERGLGVELYAKPDDRWEANEVADRCPGIVDQFLSVFEEVERRGPAGAAKPLPAELIEPTR